jgi:putative DNA primase/helicase
MVTLEQISHQCDKVQWRGKDGFTACCVAHDDRNPSMSVTERDGKLLVHCHAGCPQDAVLDALGIFDKRKDWKPAPIAKKRPTRVDTSGTEAKAARAVSLSTKAPDNHPYLIEKGIQPHGAGVLGELYPDMPRSVQFKGNVLVIPMANVHGKILSCQFIAEDFTKAYMAGPKRKGGFFFIRGGKRVWVCEGFATGASLHESTGDSVAVAFDVNGLAPVTDALTALYPTREVLIMADDDWQTDGNPGRTKARQAAQMCGVNVVVPDFTGLDRGPKDTDYNDYVRLRDGR